MLNELTKYEILGAIICVMLIGWADGCIRDAEAPSIITQTKE
jgi:hypothetical protein